MRISLAVTLGLALHPLPAIADARDDREPTAEARASADAGAFLPWTALARHDAAPAIVTLTGGWDVARDDAVFESAVEMRVGGRVALRGGAVYGSQTDRLAPVVAASVDALREERHGVDLAVLGGYEAEGFNLTPAVTARVAVGRTLGAYRVVGNAGIGVGTEQGERYGDLRLGALRRVAPAVHVGVDTRARIDLELDADEPPGELAWDVMAGPVATYSVGRVALSAGGGIAAHRPRLVGATEVGAQVTLGVGTLF